MPRLRNTRSGVVVNVDDVTAARLGDGWEVVGAQPQEKADETKKPQPRRRKASGRGK